MKKVLVLLTGIFAFFLFCDAVSAATYEIDPAHSNVSFRIRHMISTVKGEFNEFGGTIEFDQENQARSSVTAVIKAASIDTNHDERDQHLRGADFFDAEKFPEITFRSKRIEGNKVFGDLTMHGVTQEATLEVIFHGIAEDPWGRQRAGFTARTILDRKDFGIAYNKMLDKGGFLIGDVVGVDIEIEAILKK